MEELLQLQWECQTLCHDGIVLFVLSKKASRIGRVGLHFLFDEAMSWYCPEKLKRQKDQVEDKNMKNMLEEYLDVIQRASTGFEKRLFYNFAQNVMDYYNMGKTEGYKQGKADGQVEGYAEGYAVSQATLPTDPAGTAGTAVVITKGEKTITLINPVK